MKMKILVIGQGGREHAIAWKLSSSEKVEKVYVCPGNGGTAQEPAIENININTKDIPALIEFAKKKEIALTIIGPEDPLMDGIVDKFNKNNLKIFGSSSIISIVIAIPLNIEFTAVSYTHLTLPTILLV